jgi:hypothetical protein
VRVALVRFAPKKLAPIAVTFDKSRPVRFALSNFVNKIDAPDMSAPERLAPDKFDAPKSTLIRFAFDKSAPSSSAPDSISYPFTLVTVEHEVHKAASDKAINNNFVDFILDPFTYIRLDKLFDKKRQDGFVYS